MTNDTDRIFVAEHHRMVGAAIVRQLVRLGHPKDLILTRHLHELDLRDRAAVQAFFEREQPAQVYLSAVLEREHQDGSRTAQLLQEQLSIQTSVLEAAFAAGVRQLLLVVGSHSYPVNALQPMAEEDLAGGPFDASHLASAVAGSTGVALCSSYNHQYAQSHGVDYRCVVACQIYGLQDDYRSGHRRLVPRLIRRFHEAKIEQQPVVQLHEHPDALHELLFADDLAEACVYLRELPRHTFMEAAPLGHCHVSDAPDKDNRLDVLARSVAPAVGYRGENHCVAPSSQPARRRLLDTHRLRSLSWEPLMGLEYGLEISCADHELHHVRQAANPTSQVQPS